MSKKVKYIKVSSYAAYTIDAGDSGHILSTAYDLDRVQDEVAQHIGRPIEAGEWIKVGPGAPALRARAGIVANHQLYRLDFSIDDVKPGMCTAGKHGVDYKGQPCDLCAAERKPKTQVVPAKEISPKTLAPSNYLKRQIGTIVVFDTDGVPMGSLDQSAVSSTLVRGLIDALDDQNSKEI